MKNQEVKDLCAEQEGISFEEIRSWYNGYINDEGTNRYNPRSVVKALLNKRCRSYWTNTGAMDELTQYLKYNTLEIRDDIINS